MRYSVVSLNYDEVVERFANALSTTYGGDVDLLHSVDGFSSGPMPFLTKLHGSVHNSSIIPPTFNKVLDEGTIQRWS